jgi:ABC-2 type transport system ATP-binding protein
MKQVSSDPAVDAREVSFSYGDRQALQSVGFEVPRGAVRGFLGPNGSGKSTLFKLLATILPVQKGEVRMLGLDLAREMSELRKHLGVVFQSPALDRMLTVRENLVYGGHLYGLTGTELNRRVDEMLEHSGLLERARDKVAELSGGLRRRVELAKGTLHRPPLLLLDEPCTGLDPAARKDLWRFLKSQEGVTILFTTHLMDEAEESDQLTILHGGRVVGEGTPEELKKEVGTEVLEVACDATEAFATEVRGALCVEVAVVDGTLRLVSPEAHRLVPALMERFGDRVQRLTLNRPSLEDVFIAKTGHRFWADGQEAESGGR